MLRGPSSEDVCKSGIVARTLVRERRLFGVPEKHNREVALSGTTPRMNTIAYKVGEDHSLDPASPTSHTVR